MSKVAEASMRELGTLGDCRDHRDRGQIIRVQWSRGIGQSQAGQGRASQSRAGPGRLAADLTR